nr:hypothetical protein [Rhizobium laguerreae]
MRLRLDTFVVDGAKQEDVFDAIIAEIGSLRTAYDRDADPADDRPTAEAEAVHRRARSPAVISGMPTSEGPNPFRP